MACIAEHFPWLICTETAYDWRGKAFWTQSIIVYHPQPTRAEWHKWLIKNPSRTPTTSTAFQLQITAWITLNGLTICRPLRTSVIIVAIPEKLYPTYLERYRFLNSLPHSGRTNRRGKLWMPTSFLHYHPPVCSSSPSASAPPSNQTMLFKSLRRRRRREWKQLNITQHPGHDSSTTASSSSSKMHCKTNNSAAWTNPNWTNISPLGDYRLSQSVLWS